MKKIDANIILLSVITAINVISIFKNFGVISNVLVIVLCLLLIVKIKKGKNENWKNTSRKSKR